MKRRRMTVYSLAPLQRPAFPLADVLPAQGFLAEYCQVADPCQIVPDELLVSMGLVVLGTVAQRRLAIRYGESTLYGNLRALWLDDSDGLHTHNAWEPARVLLREVGERTGQQLIMADEYVSWPVLRDTLAESPTGCMFRWFRRTGLLHGENEVLGYWDGPRYYAARGRETVAIDQPAISLCCSEHTWNVRTWPLAHGPLRRAIPSFLITTFDTWAKYGPPLLRERPPVEERRRALVEWLCEFCRRYPPRPDPRRPIWATFGDTALEVAAAWMNGVTEEARSIRDLYTQALIWSFQPYLLKLAMVYQLSLDMSSEIGVGATTAAICLLEYHKAVLRALLPGIWPHWFPDACDRVRRALVATAGGTVTPRDLMRRTHLLGSELEEVLAHLERIGELDKLDPVIIDRRNRRTGRNQGDCWGWC